MHSKPVLGREEVARVLGAAREEAQRQGWAVSIAVVDDGVTRWRWSASTAARRSVPTSRRKRPAAPPSGAGKRSATRT